MKIKQQIEQDLKQAMLAGNKLLVDTLRGLKNAILYAEVAANKRDEGLPEDIVTSLLLKEVKKRQESADMYRQGGSTERAEKELAEKIMIEHYLPAQMQEKDIEILIDEIMTDIKDPSIITMGQVIGLVKQASKGLADGATIARLVKERIAKMAK
ncbi:GatB/YqeY domain-containing protein [Candidatus Saccharibacteria bacterium]|nr:GatB/YqeY domain-containing protein [Candidatus Saccharibacteria bacterium]MBI3337737.1 GatB/YqeY domain-containing protein [Candidatus Saccharibacteria bacterium]